MNPEFVGNHEANVFMEQFVREGSIPDDEINGTKKPKSKSLMDLMKPTDVDNLIQKSSESESMPISKPKSLLDYVKNSDTDAIGTSDTAYSLQDTPFSIDLISPPLIPTTVNALADDIDIDVNSMNEFPGAESEHIDVNQLHLEVGEMLEYKLREGSVEETGVTIEVESELCSNNTNTVPIPDEVEIANDTELFRKSMGLHDIIGESVTSGVGVDLPKPDDINIGNDNVVTEDISGVPGVDGIDIPSSNCIDVENAPKSKPKTHTTPNPPTGTGTMNGSASIPSNKVYDDAAIAKLLIEPHYGRLPTLYQGEVEMPSAATFISPAMRDTNMLFRNEFEEMKLHAIEPLKQQIEELQQDCMR